VQDYWLAAQERYEDALAEWLEDRHWCAVYLLGYVAEMILKHAFYRLVVTAAGCPAPILEKAPPYRPTPAATIGGEKMGNGHNLLFWAEALLQQRPPALGPMPGGDPLFRARVMDLHKDWSEAMRYRASSAGAPALDVLTFMSDVDWLRDNAVKFWS